MNIDNTSIHIYYHCALMGRYLSIVPEQITTIKKSGVLNNGKLTILALGGDVALIKKNIGGIACEIIESNEEYSSFEFPTLLKIYKDCQESNELIFYIHSKGVSKHKTSCCNKYDTTWYCDSWRIDMMNSLITNYKDCLFGLGLADVCGWSWNSDINRMSTQMKVNSDRLNGWYEGNFWCTRSKIIRSLPNPEHLNRMNRYEAEAWIGKSSIRPIRYLCLKSGKSRSYLK